MSSVRPPPGTIPTLTEVVPWPGAASPGEADEPRPPSPTAAATVPPAAAPSPPAAAPVPPAVAPVPPAATPAPMAAPTPAPAAAAAVAAAPAPAVAPSTAVPAATTAPSVAAVPAAPALVSQDELARTVLADVQRQVDLMLDVRLREALAPVLARATDALIRDARKELTAALHDVVTRSVAQELARLRER